MTLNLTPDIAAGLTTLAAANGLSVEEYLRRIVEHELSTAQADQSQAEEGSGMVLESGLLIYGAGTALPSAAVDDAIRRSRDDRSQHLLGSSS